MDIAAAVGSDAEPTAKKPRTEPYVWLQVKGGARAIGIDTVGLRNVKDLLRKVKEEKLTQLKDVDTDFLSTYQSVEVQRMGGKAIGVDQWLSELEGGETVSKALFVDYPAPSAAASSLQALPQPTARSVKAPELPALVPGELLNVEGFRDFVVAGTTVDRPLYLRKHLIDVHDVAINALKKNRLVSLVGCPGVGKTWCGLLVAHTLQSQGVHTLHLTVRREATVAIITLSERKEYTVKQFGSLMLYQAITEAKCEVCVLDVGGTLPLVSEDIFIGVRTLLEDKAFSNVNIMGIFSGYGEETITGKQCLSTMPTQRLVMWSWTAEEVDALSKRMPGGIEEGAFAVCGGSVRHLFEVKTDQDVILRAVKGMDETQMRAFAWLDAPTTDEGHRQRKHLLSFVPERDGSDFKQGTVAACRVPRSDYVIQCISENRYAKMEDVAIMYGKLSAIRSGAAGTIFKLMVHMFWREKVKDNAKVELRLIQILPTDEDGPEEDLIVDCSKLTEVVDNIEEWDDKEGEPPLGYYTPKNARYPVLDSILRFRTHEETLRVLPIQVSIAVKHGHGDLKHKLLDTEQKQLALWDYRAGGKTCQWSPSTSDYWQLCRVECKEFNDLMSRSSA